MRIPLNDGGPIFGFWASRPCTAAVWLAMLLIKADCYCLNNGYSANSIISARCTACYTYQMRCSLLHIAVSRDALKVLSSMLFDVLEKFADKCLLISHGSRRAHFFHGPQNIIKTNFRSYKVFRFKIKLYIQLILLTTLFIIISIYKLRV